MRLTKREREAVRAKFAGLCAYCGYALGERWHADHFEPVIRRSKWQSGVGFQPTGEVVCATRDVVANLMPACAPCNIDKATHGLEGWRSKLQTSCDVLARNSSTYRHARRFSLVIETGERVRFFFERTGTIDPTER